MQDHKAPSRLRLDSAALVTNWRWLARQSGAAACGAAIKADGYGLGARAVLDHLARSGCRDFFVATWAEAAALGALPDGCQLSVLHGVRDEDMALAAQIMAKPVLNTLAQVQRWTASGMDSACDVMIDTGMNRLGLSVSDVASGLLNGLRIDTLMSHLASADEDSRQNQVQLRIFQALVPLVQAKRLSLANSAGIMLGSDYHYDLTRPGLSLYGGIARPEMRGAIQQVAYLEAQILQRRRLAAGDAIGYNATFVAPRDMEVAILNLGYADGYLRSFSAPTGHVGGSAGAGRFPLIGRVSMDLIAICVDAQPDMAEGDWITIDYDLARASAISGLSPYELLTNLGARHDRVWV